MNIKNNVGLGSSAHWLKLCICVNFLVKMPVCGPKLSLCCTILSVWGIFQLTLMGIFFHINSVALIEDIHLEEVSE